MNEEIFIYWIDKYTNGYRSGVSHGSRDGGITLCNRNIENMKWDGGYVTLKTHNIECKNCMKVLAINKTHILEKLKQ